jgi:putative transposase
MSKLDYKELYRRNLPHIQPPGATLFVTFRLAGSLPRHVLEALYRQSEERLAAKQHTLTTPELHKRELYNEHKRLFAQIDHYLDTTQDGPHWLKEPAVAQMVVESLHYRHGKVYDLDTFCLMSNHGHVLFTPLEKENGRYHSLSSIMHSLKLFTANQANDILQRRGAFWQHESYDHFVRDEAELRRIRRYILQNPVQARLVEHWEDWPWSFTRYPL